MVKHARWLVVVLVTVATATSCAHRGLTQRVSILGGEFGVAGGVRDDVARDLKVQVPVGGGCDQTGTASVKVVESAAVVSLAATVTRTTAPKALSDSHACPANLVAQTVAVHLGRPLGRRVVRDAVADRSLVRQRFAVTPQ